MLKVLDLFSGIGGFHSGFTNVSDEFQIVGFCEINQAANAAYRMMYTITEEQRTKILELPFEQRKKELQKPEYLNDVWYGNDISKIQAAELPKVDIWTFGAPCINFSFAGKKDGIEGKESILIREVFRLLNELTLEQRPEWIIYENVRGMFSSNQGRDYAEILNSMVKLGYNVGYQMLNSRHYGVPQSRERVYTVGHLRSRGGKLILPFSNSHDQITELGGQQALEAATGEENTRIKEDPQITATVNSKFNVGLIKQIIGKDPSQTDRIYLPDGISPTLTTACATQIKVLEIIKSENSVFTPDGSNLINDWQNGLLKFTKHEDKDCLEDQSGNKFFVRGITPREAWRLQGFTDKQFDLTSQVCTNSELFKQAGNAATVNVVSAIAKEILKLHHS